MDELVCGVLVPSVTSLAAAVAVPEVFGVTLRLLGRATRGVLPGSEALASEQVKATVWETLVTTFQFASTAFTVMLKAVPAVCAVGVPVFPEAVPGAGISPGAKICSLTKDPELTPI